MRLLGFWLALGFALAATAAHGQQDASEPEATGVPWQAQIYSNFTNWGEEELAERDEWTFVTAAAVRSLLTAGC
jgi:hypothetical protein